MGHEGRIFWGVQSTAYIRVRVQHPDWGRRFVHFFFKRKAKRRGYLSRGPLTVSLPQREKKTARCIIGIVIGEILIRIIIFFLWFLVLGLLGNQKNNIFIHIGGLQSIFNRSPRRLLDLR
jgi:hypothetical protein